jgi:hypothetical protein
LQEREKELEKDRQTQLEEEERQTLSKKQKREMELDEETRELRSSLKRTNRTAKDRGTELDKLKGENEQKNKLNEEIVVGLRQQIKDFEIRTEDAARETQEKDRVAFELQTQYMNFDEQQKRLRMEQDEIVKTLMNEMIGLKLQNERRLSELEEGQQKERAECESSKALLSRENAMMFERMKRMPMPNVLEELDPTLQVLQQVKRKRMTTTEDEAEETETKKWEKEEDTERKKREKEEETRRKKREEKEETRRKGKRNRREEEEEKEEKEYEEEKGKRIITRPHDERAQRTGWPPRMS